MANITSLDFYAEQIPGFYITRYDSSVSKFILGAQIKWSPADADVDFEYSSSNPSLISYFSSGRTTTSSTHSRAYIYYYLNADYDTLSPSGYSILTVTERNSGLQLSRRVYNYPEGESPSVYFSPSALTVDWDVSASTSNKVLLGDVVTDDVTLSARTSLSVYSANGLSIDGTTGKLYCTSLSENYSETDRITKYRGSVFDTDGNAYIVKFDLTQDITPVYERAFDIEGSYWEQTGSPIDYNYSGSPSNAIPGYIYTEFCGTSIDCTAELDTGSTPGLITLLDTWSGTNQYPEYKVFYVNMDVNMNVHGSATIIINDRVSGNQVRRTLHNTPLAPPDSPGYCSPSAVTISSAATEPVNERITDVYTKDGFRADDLNNTRGRFFSDNITWDVTEIPRIASTISSYSSPYTGYSATCRTYLAKTVANTGNSRTVVFYGQVKGKVPKRHLHDDYLYTFTLTQEGALSRDIEIAQAAFEIESGSSTTSIQVGSSGCTYSGFSYTTGGSFSVTATTGVGSAIVFSFPENDTPVARTGYAYMTYYDTDGNAYQQTITITQEPASDDPEGTSISHPVNGHFVPGMLKLRTTIEDGKVYTTGNASLYPGLGYYKQVKCAPYILYYLNSYGGWDAFVIEGTVIKRDSITSYMTDRSYKNTTLQFETNKYTNEIKTSYELNTGLLSDEESANVAKNLVGSLKVYMHNLQEGWIKPVIITDSSVTYQTYETNGKKLSQYRINITESQSKLRK